MSMEDYRTRVASEVEQAILMSREIGAKVNVTPEDVQRYYDEHIDEYTQPAQIRVRHVFRPLSPSANEAEERGSDWGSVPSSVSARWQEKISAIWQTNTPVGQARAVGGTLAILNGDKCPKASNRSPFP